jgi:pyrroloquinoline quinone biosynthesis protein B
MIDATWQFASQLDSLDRAGNRDGAGAPDGILLTHAHTGHYTGLVHLGREMMASHELPVWVMPRMAEFLSSNQPWASLVDDRNIVLRELAVDRPLCLGDRLSVRPLPVSHRDELSETVAFEITGPNRRALWLPDIDAWGERLEELVSDVDVAWLDGTFYDDTELPGRDIRQVPHPRVARHLEEYARLATEADVDVRLVHLNHSNPLCDPRSRESQEVEASGVGIACEGERVEL